MVLKQRTFPSYGLKETEMKWVRKMRDPLGLEDEETGGHEPRIVVGRWKPEKKKTQILP